ncbi:hypothetical protein [Nocardioides insulae]|nr:hypothetical protein [Nocardioides insulae]
MRREHARGAILAYPTALGKRAVSGFGRDDDHHLAEDIAIARRLIAS